MGTLQAEPFADVSRPEYTSKIKKALRRRHVEKAITIARVALKQYPKSAGIRDHLISALDYAGQIEEAYQLARKNARKHIAALEKRKITGGDPESVDANACIFLSGYFYSGSGAVLDFLRGLEGALKWYPIGEMRLVKFPGGLADLSSRFERNGALVQSDLLDLYLHLRGRKLTYPKKGKYSKWAVVNRNSRKLWKHDMAAAYLQTCLRAFLDLESSCGGFTRGKDLESHLRNILDEALRAAFAQTRARILLIDQGVTAWRLPIARLVPPSMFIIVHRDPRDQFAEARDRWSKTGRKIRSAEEFARMYRSHREIVERSIPHLAEQYNHRFIRLAFEDFVFEHETKGSELLEKLGLQDHGWSGRHFEPAQSKKNIGKHSHMISDAERRILEMLLPEYLDDRATTRASLAPG